MSSHEEAYRNGSTCGPDCQQHGRSQVPFDAKTAAIVKLRRDGVSVARTAKIVGVAESTVERLYDR